jgi:hypothetical protein
MGNNSFWGLCQGFVSAYYEIGCAHEAIGFLAMHTYYTDGVFEDMAVYSVRSEER